MDLKDAWKYIDLTRVGARRDHPDLPNTLNRLLADLSIPQRIEAVCIHEAGHYIYFKKAGIRTTFEPPSVYWSEETKRFGYFLAAVDTPDVGEFFTGYSNEFLSELAKAGIAATLVITKLLNEPDRYELGESVSSQLRDELGLVEDGDYQAFRRRCLYALRTNSIDFKPRERWELARTEVNYELSATNVMQDILSAASTVRTECFKERNALT
jgi:hypothetical protein